MSNRGKTFTKEQVKEILGINEVTWEKIKDYQDPAWDMQGRFLYSRVVEYEVSRILLALGYDKEKSGQFCSFKICGILRCEYIDDISSSDIKINLTSVREQLDKKIAAWEMSKKPAEKMNPYEEACKEFLKGCPDTKIHNTPPSACFSCTAAFLKHIEKLSEEE